MKLKTKMLLVLLVPVVISIGLLSYYAYHTARNALKDQILSTNEATTKYYSGMINENLLKHEVTVTNLANIVASRAALSPAEMDELVKSPRSRENGIVTLCLAFENQQYVDSDGWTPPADYDHRQREWYKKIMDSDGKIVYSDVYTDMVSNQLLVIVGKPIVVNGKKIGVVTSNVNLNDLLAKTKEVKIGNSGYIFVVSNKGELISHPEFKSDDLIQEVYAGALKPYYQNLLEDKNVAEPVTIDGAEKLYGGSPIGNAGWFLGSSSDTEELFSKIDAMAYTLAGACVLVMIALSVLILSMTFKITTALRAMMVQSKQMAEGDFTEKASAAVRNDEIGQLAKALDEMKQHLRRLIRQVGNSADQLAASSEELTAGADQSSQAANQIAESITSVAHGADRQLGSVEQTSEAVKRISGDIVRLTDYSGIIEEKTVDTAEKTRVGREIVGNVINQMETIEKSVTVSAELVGELGERSKEIGQIVDTIGSIAGQTNLLSLNAAIEAARAGEHGKGFAVVAEEVRKLAEQSQVEAKHIADLIGKIQQDTEKAVGSMQGEKREVTLGMEVVKEAQQIFAQIDEMIAEITAMTSKEKETTVQIADGSKRVVSAVEEIDQVCRDTASETETISAATEQQAASMEEMSSASQSLAKLAQDLQGAINQFRV